jgi:hypothetical protein
LLSLRNARCGDPDEKFMQFPEGMRKEDFFFGGLKKIQYLRDRSNDWGIILKWNLDKYDVKARNRFG